MDLIRKFFDLGNVLIVLEVVENFEESLEEQCSLPILPEDHVDHVVELCCGRELASQCVEEEAPWEQL